MSTDGVIGASWLPTDGYLDPSRLTYALADGARARRLPDPHAHPRDRRSTSAAAPCAASRTDRGDVECEVVVDAGGMYAAEIARLAGVRVPIVPMAHEYLVTAAVPRAHAASTCRRCATPTTSSTSARRAAGW